MADIHGNPKRFFELTIHDDVSSHQSQFVRRYGNNLNTKDIDDISRIGISLSSARTNLIVSPLQIVSESILVDAMINGSFDRVEAVCLSHVIPEVLPPYVRYLDLWAENSDEENKDYKAFISMKLQEISSILESSPYLAPRLEGNTTYSLQDIMTNFEKLVFPSIYALSDYHAVTGLSKDNLENWSKGVSTASIHDVIKEHSSDSPIARMSSTSFKDMCTSISKSWSQAMVTASEGMRELFEKYDDKFPDDLPMKTIEEDEIEFLEELEDEDTLNLTNSVSDEELWSHLRRRAAERESVTQPAIE